MAKKWGIRVFGMICLAIFGYAVARAGQSAAITVAVAPVPSSLLSAKKIFVSNGGADAGLFPHPFSGGPERGYNQLYADLQAWSGHELVSDPAEADVVLELQLIAPPGPKDADKQKGSADPLPMFRLTVYDRKTHYVLWTLTHSIYWAFRQDTHDHNFDEALNLIVSDLKKLTDKNSVAAR